MEVPSDTEGIIPFPEEVTSGRGMDFHISVWRRAAFG